MTVHFVCPHCEYPGHLTWGEASEWRCPSCAQVLNIAESDSQLATCALCGNHELYKKKDFPHWLGMTILTVAIALSVYTYLWYEKWLTWALLVGSAILDVLLYALVGDVVVCYRCNAHYRRLPPSAAHKPFDLSTGERYRQEKIRQQLWKNQ